MFVVTEVCCQSPILPILELRWAGENSFLRQWADLLEQVSADTSGDLLHMLVDLGHLPPLPVKIQYKISRCLPQLHHIGLARLAVLLPDDVYSRLMVEHLLMNSLSSHIATDIQFFTACDQHIALDWLQHGLLANGVPDLPARPLVFVNG